MTFATPASPIAYPIGGLSFVNAYTCYSTAAARDALASTAPGRLGLPRWFYGTARENKSDVKVELNRNGFGVLPGSWISAVKELLTVSAATKIGIPGQLKTGCATVTGGA